MAEQQEIIIRIRTIAECKINKVKYLPGIFIDGLSDEQIEKGLADGYLAEIPHTKGKKKGAFKRFAVKDKVKEEAKDE